MTFKFSSTLALLLYLEGSLRGTRTFWIESFEFCALGVEQQGLGFVP